MLSSEAVLQGIGQDTAAVESQVEVLQSNEFARRIVDRLALVHDREFASGGLVEAVLRATGLASAGSQSVADVERNKVVTRFQRQLDVRRRGLTYVLEVNFQSRDAVKSANIANALADAYIDEQRSNKLDATSGASDWLGSRIDALRQAVKASEQTVADFKSANDIVDTDMIGSGQTLNQRQRRRSTASSSPRAAAPPRCRPRSRWRAACSAIPPRPKA